MKSEICIVSNKELSGKRSLRRHKQTVHKQYTKNNFSVCHECGYERSRFIELENHMRENHLSFRPWCCLYCNNYSWVTHLTLSTWIKIMVSRYGPRTQKLSHQGLFPLRSLWMVLLLYTIIRWTIMILICLLSFMPGKQNEIQNVIQLNTQNQPRKVQFNATIELMKPVDDEVWKMQSSI